MNKRILAFQHLIKSLNEKQEILEHTRPEDLYKKILLHNTMVKIGKQLESEEKKQKDPLIVIFCKYLKMKRLPIYK